MLCFKTYTYRSINLFAFGLATLVISSCSKNTIIPGPREFYLIPKISNENSVINVLAEISTSQTGNLLNTKLPEVLYEDANIDDDNYTVKVTKRTSFVFEPIGNFIYITAPLTIDAKARMGVGFLRTEQEGKFDLDVRFKMQPIVSKTWELNSNTSIDSYNWINEPKIKIGPFEMSVAPYLEKVIDSQKGLISAKIDEMVKKTMDIKPLADFAWKFAQRPFSINSSIGAWTKIEPMSIYMVPFEGNKETIKFGIGIKAILETFIGSKPFVNISPLPPLDLGSSSDSLFTINLVSKIGFAEATAIAKERLVNTEFAFNNEKYKIKLTDISFYGSGEYLVAKTTLAGDYNGVIYFYGVPVFDSLSQSLKIKDIDFTTESNKGLKNKFAWLMKGNIKRKMSEYLNFSLKDKSSQSADLLTNYLNSIKLTDKVKINAKVFSLLPHKILISENQFIVAFQAKGKIKLQIDVSDFK